MKIPSVSNTAVTILRKALRQSRNESNKEGADNGSFPLPKPFRREVPYCVTEKQGGGAIGKTVEMSGKTARA